VRRVIEISVIGRSLVQRSSTECGVSECVRGTSQRRRGPTDSVEPYKTELQHYQNKFATSCCQRIEVSLRFKA
jgi:hypothetical protein